MYDSLYGIAEGLRLLAAHPDVAVLRVKNRFHRPDPADPAGPADPAAVPAAAAARGFSRTCSHPHRVRAADADAAAAAGGYRDVAVNLRFRPDGPAAAAAAAAGGHVCEVQLQLLAVTRQRSEAGHRRYIAFRNATGT